MNAVVCNIRSVLLSHAIAHRAIAVVLPLLLLLQLLL
jgi:hypothetical protein